MLSTPEAFEQFAKLVNDPDFRQLLEAAQADPAGPEAARVLRRVLPFISLCGSRISWSGTERGAEITRHLAISQYSGHGSNFISAAPDDVHDLLTIRHAHPTRSTTSFPNVCPEEFLKALQAETNGERVVALPADEPFPHLYGCIVHDHSVNGELRGPR